MPTWPPIPATAAVCSSRTAVRFRRLQPPRRRSRASSDDGEGLPERDRHDRGDGLSGLSQELALSRLPRADGYFTVAEYCKAYRRAGNYPLRHRQIKLIGDIGGALDRYVGKPLIRTALALMRGPARMPGFAVLQDFLERGFAAFHAMGGAQTVLQTIETRETQILEAIVSGVSDPFPDPLAFRLSQPSAART
jgi:hypothetical protein